MAGQKKIGIMAKHGNRIAKAQEAHKNDPIDFGFRRLPAGVKGVARLVKCGFKLRDKDPHKGEAEWSATASVVESTPPGHEGAYITIGPMFYGLYDQVDDKGKLLVDSRSNLTMDLDYQYNRIMTEMWRIGGEAFAKKHQAAKTDPEDVAALLVKAAPYIRFETKEGKSKIVDGKAVGIDGNGKVKVDKKTNQPRPPDVYENWYGSNGLEDYHPPAKNGKAGHSGQTTEDGVVDETHDDTTTTDEVVDETQDAEELDLDALAAAAEKGDDNAGEKLLKLGSSLGLSDDLMKVKSKTWAVVVSHIRKAQKAAETTEETTEETTTEETTTEETVEEVVAEEETAEEPAVKVGAVMLYHVVKKNDAGKLVKEKKATSVEVLETDEDKQTAKIKNLVNGTTVYKGVRWSDLTPDS